MSIYKRNSWKNLSASFRRENPVCFFCHIESKVKACDVSDHIYPIELGGAFLDRNNLQALCHSHHNIKTKQNEKGVFVAPFGSKPYIIPAFKAGGGSSETPINPIPTPASLKLRTHSIFAQKTKIKFELYGNVHSGKSTVAHFLSALFQIPVLSIDSYRRSINPTGSYSGEYHAWDMMYQDSLRFDSYILESSGVSNKLLRFRKKNEYVTIKVQAPTAVLMQRVKDRTKVPLPAMYGSLHKAMYFLEKELATIKTDITLTNTNEDTIDDLQDQLWRSLVSRYPQLSDH